MMKKIFYQISCTFFCFTLLMACAESQNNKKETQEQRQEQQKDVKDGQNSDQKVILFYGNSLTAGYGLKDWQSFPALIQNKIDSLGLNYKVVNAGLSGETSSGGKERINWVLRNPVDIFVLELGANDMLRGLDLKSTRENLSNIFDQVLEKYPSTKLVVVGMQAPPNMGENYSSSFAKIFPALAQKYNARLIPFLLDGVAGIDSLNLPDGKHPNAQGQKIVAENVWEVLKPIL